ncbi:MAG: hypothetical protein J0I01_16375 [Stenotrophomonas nitritireducens]|nr:hypothetical protein [Stenotrophomonas nitritireducens]MBN8793801.1 hypothetical protein [Stenotrophomonas nitritireducens]MBN8796240.1 hypothetical protein [Stenotrophomonas nitritireducens]
MKPADPPRVDAAFRVAAIVTAPPDFYFSRCNGDVAATTPTRFGERLSPV